MPSNRISVRNGPLGLLLGVPRLRRLRTLPWIGALEKLLADLPGLSELENCGNLLSASAMPDGVVRARSCVVATVTGVGAVYPSRTMRDPVTMMSGALTAASCGAADVAASCATACPARAIMLALIASVDMRICCFDIIIPLPGSCRTGLCARMFDYYPGVHFYK